MLLDLYGDVDLGDPLGDHPLNDGRVLWLLGVPPLDGSSVWYDLCQRSNATLTGGPTWTPTGRGDAGLSFPLTGSAGATAVFPSDVTTKSLAFWSNWTTALDRNLFVGAAANNTVQTNGSNVWLVFDGGNRTFSTGPTVGVWERTAFVWGGTTISLYVNGVFRQSVAGATSSLAVGQVGRSSPAGTGFGGLVSDVGIWSRVMSADEVAADYEQSLAGYPDVLRRHRRATWMLAGGGGATFNPAWAYRSTVVLGGAF